MSNLSLKPNVDASELEMLQRAMEHAVDGASRLGADGRYTFVNERYGKIAGRDPASLIGADWRETVHPSDVGRLEEAYQKMLETGKVVEEVRVRRPDDCLIYKRVTMIAERAANGLLLGHFCFAQDITHEIAGREENRRRGDWLDLTESVGRIGYWFLDLVENRLYWSKEVYAIHGLDPDGHTPTLENAISAYHPDDQAIVAECVQAAIDEREPFMFEKRIVQPDGSIRWIWSRGECRTGPEGEPAAIFGLFRDITEEHSARAFQESALAILSKPAETAQARVIAMLTAANEHLHTGSAYLHLEADDTDPVLIHAPDMQGWTLDNARALLALPSFAPGTTDKTVLLDTAPRKEQESLPWVGQILAAPLRIDGQIAGTIGFFKRDPRVGGFKRPDHDIVELLATWCVQELQRQFAADRIQTSEERFALAVSGSGVGISDWRDVSRDEVIWSDQHFRMLGYRPGEFKPTTKCYEEMVHPEDIKSVADAVQRHMRDGKPYVQEARIRMKDGQYRWFEGTGQAVWARDGAPLRMIGSIVDIEARKRLEAERVEFFSTVSHELRTPLTGLMGVLSLLQTGSYGTLTEKGQHLLSIARNSGDRLVRLVNDLLDIEKLDAGQFAVAPTGQRVWPLIERAVEECCTALRQNGMTIALVNEAPHAVAMLDTDRFIQVMANLLSNAGKFTPTEGTITISVAEREKACLISVIDTGPGIPEDQLNRIFNRFTQVDSSTSRATEGTGLGLAIARAIIHAHGGSITASNEPGAGARFDVCLPLAAPRLAG